MRVFLDEADTWISRLSKADGPPPREWASSNPLQAWTEKKGWVRRNLFLLCLLVIILCFILYIIFYIFFLFFISLKQGHQSSAQIWIPTGTNTIGSPAFQVYTIGSSWSELLSFHKHTLLSFNKSLYINHIFVYTHTYTHKHILFVLFLENPD